jgi:hypothetical protein
VIQKDPEIVAQILADHAAGTSPSKIGRRLEVHHTTVTRILAGASGFTALADRWVRTLPARSSA